MTSANNAYLQHQGSDKQYQHWFGFTYTEGVMQLAYDCECFWLLDVITSHQCKAKVKAEAFQVWTLERIAGQKFLVVATDGNDNLIAKQVIPFSDFRYDQCIIWLVNDGMLLPSEY